MRTIKLTRILGVILSLFLYSTVSTAASLSEAKALHNKGNTRQALTEIDSYLQEDANNINALFFKAQLQYELGRRDSAVATYRSIIKQAPKQLEAYNNLAAIYAQHNNLHAASEVLEQAIHVDPVYATIYDNLRAVYWDMSKRHVRAALKLKPLNSGAKLVAINAPSNLPDTEPDPTSVAASAATVASKASVEATAEPKPIETVNVENTQVVSQVKEDSKPQAEMPEIKQPKPKPAVKPATKPKPQSTDEERVRAAIQNWTKSWSARDVDAYISHYVRNYKPAGKSRSEWVAGRKWNFKSKQFIKIGADKIKIRKSGPHYIATFNQSYQSDLYRDKVLKEIRFTQQDGEWKISDELALKAL